MSTPNPTTNNRSFGRLGGALVVTAAVAASTFGAAMLAGAQAGQDGPGSEIAIEPAPTTQGVTTIAERPASTVNLPSTLAPTTAPSTTPSTAPTTAPPTTVQSTTSTTQLQSSTCATARYTLTLEPGWFHESCEAFSTAPIPAPGPREFRPEIDASFSNTETYAQAINRINSTMTVITSQPTTVDGQTATVFRLQEEWYDIGERIMYVVDAGDGVFIASVNELVDSDATFADRGAHYIESAAALQQMMLSADIVYVANISNKQATCAAPVYANPTVLNSISFDVTNDGLADTISIVRHDAGTNLLVDAGPVVGVLEGKPSFADITAPAEIAAVDLDADGVSEIIASFATGAYTTSYEAFFLDAGCTVSRIGGPAQPQIEVGASVQNVVSFTCSYGFHGTVDFDEVVSSYVDASGQWETTTTTFRYSNGAWTDMGSFMVTGPNPPALDGLGSC